MGIIYKMKKIQYLSSWFIKLRLTASNQEVIGSQKVFWFFRRKKKGKGKYEFLKSFWHTKSLFEFLLVVTCKNILGLLNYRVRCANTNMNIQITFRSVSMTLTVRNWIALIEMTLVLTMEFSNSFNKGFPRKKTKDTKY